MATLCCWVASRCSARFPTCTRGRFITRSPILRRFPCLQIPARILIARKDLPVDSLKDFIAYAQSNQAKMQFGSAGAGSGLHICAVLLNTDMGTIITHVPYRGSAPAMQDLMAGRIDFMCEQISTALPQIQAGVVKAIATLGPARSSALPDLPTAQEQGLADLDCSTWSASCSPSRRQKRSYAGSRRRRAKRSICRSCASGSQA